jgi:hypothetical protein
MVPEVGATKFGIEILISSKLRGVALLQAIGIFVGTAHTPRTAARHLTVYGPRLKPNRKMRSLGSHIPDNRGVAIDDVGGYTGTGSLARQIMLCVGLGVRRRSASQVSEIANPGGVTPRRRFTPYDRATGYRQCSVRPSFGRGHWDLSISRKCGG